MKRIIPKFSPAIPVLLLILAAFWTCNGIAVADLWGSDTKKKATGSGPDRQEHFQGKEIWMGKSFGSLPEILTHLGSNQLTLHIPSGRWNVSESCIIPENVTLKPERGAMLALADGVTLTIKGRVEAGLYQIFFSNNQGKVVFGSNPEKVYAEWWGAVPGDYPGEAMGPDSAGAISAAANSLAKGVVQLTSGTYLAQSPILIPDNVQLVGMGAGRTVIQPTANCRIEAPSACRAGILMTTGNHANIAIRELTVDGNKAYNISAKYNGILVGRLPTTGWADQYGSNILLENVTVVNVPRNDFNHTGIGLSLWADDVRVAGCDAYNNGTVGFWLRGYRHQVTNSTSHDNGDDGIDTWCDDLVVSNCSLYRNAGAGINPTGNLVYKYHHLNNAVGNVNVRIENCYIHDNVGEGIAAPNIEAFVIANNVIYANGSGGISAAGGVIGTITGNIIRSPNDGLAVGTMKQDGNYRRGRDILIANNFFYNNGKNIKVKGYEQQNASRLKIDNNVISGGEVGIFFENSHNDGAEYSFNLFSSNKKDVEVNESYVQRRGQKWGVLAPYLAELRPANAIYDELSYAMTLKGNLTVNAPEVSNRGDVLHFTFTQDGAGGRKVTFNPIYKANWTPDTGAGKINSISFRYDGNNWVQSGAATGM